MVVCLGTPYLQDQAILIVNEQVFYCMKNNNNGLADAQSQIGALVAGILK